MKTLTPAKFVDCPGLQEGKYAHSMRDGCWSCAPYWETIQVCPTDNVKLRQTETNWTRYDPKAPVKGYCRTCRKHFDISNRRGWDSNVPEQVAS